MWRGWRPGHIQCLGRCGGGGGHCNQCSRLPSKQAVVLEVNPAPLAFVFRDEPSFFNRQLVLLLARKYERLIGDVANGEAANR